MSRAGQWRTNGCLSPFAAGTLRMGSAGQTTGEQQQNCGEHRQPFWDSGAWSALFDGQIKTYTNI
ncbi:MAG TPA: hypothetical protein PLI34_16380, partial [Saprospiraceae bacterium]|nr:hypothetical protein [Saprospiraceae bacterium]